MRWYRSSRILQWSIIILLGIFAMGPLLWIVFCSFENPVLYKVENIFIWMEKYLSVEQYADILFHNLEYWAAYWNTIFLTVPTIIAAIGIASMAAYGLAVMKKQLQNRILFVYAILSLLPMQALLVPHLISLSNLHLNGSRLAVILIGSCSPWYVFFLYRLCKRIPVEVLEMARVEGASEWTVFRKIALPQMRLGIMVFGIIISADLWGMVEEPLVYIQDPAKYPLSVLFHETGADIPYAGVVIFSLPVVLVFLGGIRKTMKGEE